MVTPLPRRRVQVVAQQATTLDRLSGGRVVLALGLGVDSYGEYSAFDEPATDDRARAGALDAGIELLVPMLEGAPVPQLGGRTTTRAGVQQPRVPDLDRRRHAAHGGTAARRPPRTRRDSPWSGEAPGRRRRSRRRSPPADCSRARSTSSSSAATRSRTRRGSRAGEARPGASPRSGPGEPAAAALSRVAALSAGCRRRRPPVAEREGVVADAVAPSTVEAVERLVDARHVAGGDPPTHEERLVHALEPLPPPTEERRVGGAEHEVVEIVGRAPHGQVDDHERVVVGTHVARGLARTRPSAATRSRVRTRRAR